jgi:hemolysin activation/secretion protein
MCHRRRALGVATAAGIVVLLSLLASSEARAQGAGGVPVPIERPFQAERPTPGIAPEKGDIDLGSGRDGDREGDGPDLPSAPPPSAAELEALGAKAGIVVRALDVVGNTVFDDAALTRAVAPWLGRPLDSADLERIRRALTAVYVDAGYVSSGARLPEQDVADGRLRIEITEGTLAGIEIAGARRYRESVLRARLLRAAGTPVRVGELESALRVLSQDPRIARLDARLEPGPRPGTSILQIALEETDPADLEFAFDNHETPSVGEFGGHVQVAHGNPLGLGDRLGGDLTVAEGRYRVGGRYAIPIHPSGTELTLDGRYSHADIVDSTLEALDIRSETLSYAVGLNQTLYRTPRDWLEAGVSLDLRRSQSRIFGDESFPFFDGTDNGRSELTVLRADLGWTRRLRSSALAFRTLFSWGLDAFGATMHHDSGAPDGIFFSWVGQLRFLHRFETTGVELELRGDVQLADRSLLPLEQFAVGGPGSVRGYRTNQQAGDEGFAAAVDVRLPLVRTDTGRNVLSVIPFADLGRIWNLDGPSAGEELLPSLGAGLEWEPHPTFSFRFDWAGAFQSAPSEENLQDHGVTFRVSWRPR